MSTQKTVALEAGVSQVTVSQILGGRLAHRYNAETHQRVLDAAKKLNYYPNRSAQTMRSGRSNLIVYLNFGGYTELAAKRTYHIGRLIHEAGFDYQTIDAYWWIGDSRRIIKQIIGLQPEGLLIGGSLQFSFGKESIEELFKAGIPVVTVGSMIAGVPRVNHSGKKATGQFAKQALMQGRRFLVLDVDCDANGVVSWHGQQKIAGFEEAIAEAGGIAPPARALDLTYHPRPVEDGIRTLILTLPVRGPSFQPFQRGSDTMNVLCDWPERPDAVIFGGDYDAIGALTACQTRGIDVPGDILIAGSNDLAYSSQGTVALTTVQVPIEELCNAAMGMLLTRIGKKPEFETQPEEQIFVQKPVWRKSLPLAVSSSDLLDSESPRLADQ